MDPWKPTPELRFVMAEFMVTENTMTRDKVLQQRWMHVDTGEAEWRDVPLVVEL